jgi:hypothetical protein
LGGDDRYPAAHAVAERAEAKAVQLGGYVEGETMPKINDMRYYDDVRGTIIGDVTFPYEFWRKHPDFGWDEKIARGFFRDDDEAVSWFMVHYPEEYRAGAEMRVFDK